MRINFSNLLNNIIMTIRRTNISVAELYFFYRHTYIKSIRSNLFMWIFFFWSLNSILSRRTHITICIRNNTLLHSSERTRRDSTSYIGYIQEYSEFDLIMPKLVLMRLQCSFSFDMNSINTCMDQDCFRSWNSSELWIIIRRSTHGKQNLDQFDIRLNKKIYKTRFHLFVSSKNINFA